MEEIIKNRYKKLNKRKKRKAYLRTLLFLVLIISVASVLAFKLSYFNITNIIVSGNKITTKEEILMLSKINKGSNIFYINTSDAKKTINTNSYISEVSISRKLPSTINIDVKERNLIFYGQLDNKYYMLDENGVVVDIRDNLINDKLIKLDGVNLKDSKLGKPVAIDDSRKLDIIKQLSSLIIRCTSPDTITNVNIADLINIQVFYNSICVKLGTAQDIEKKINKAINIFDKENLKDAKGYIDVSFDGNPVFLKQN